MIDTDSLDEVCTLILFLFGCGFALLGAMWVFSRATRIIRRHPQLVDSRSRTAIETPFSLDGALDSSPCHPRDEAEAEEIDKLERIFALE